MGFNSAFKGLSKYLTSWTILQAFQFSSLEYILDSVQGKQHAYV